MSADPDRPDSAQVPARRKAGPRKAPSFREPLLVVGIGASAGGLEAFGKLVHELPSKTGAAYVLVQHLDPSHESALPELLARSTVLPVIEVRETIRIEPDHVYVMPAAMDLAIQDGHLKLLPRALSRGQHMPIDFFFRSLAAAQAERAIGVILSGTGSDGTLGLKEIKLGGGLCLAQEPESAKYDGMPRSAIAAGCVDTILPPEALAREIVRLADASRGDLQAEPAAGPAAREEEAALDRILRHVARVTGNDLAFYKEPTQQRRVRRRMALLRVRSLADYARFVEVHPAEVQALYEDLLIHVTSFFRGDSSFRALSRKVFPELVKDRSGETPLRIWVPGCSTGEEVYSLAICLVESLGEMGVGVPIQIFGTDVRMKAIEQSRAGIFPESIAADVSPERLARFFVRADDRFQVSKSVRDLCVFAQHDLIRDPPFSRMDLISCRNVLIYFTAETQKRIFANFHYALSPKGYLLLGSEENAVTSSGLFEAFDREHKIFVSTAVAARPVFGGGGVRDIPPRAGLPPPGGGRRADVQRQADRILLGRYSPPAVLVDAALEILLFRGDTQPFLEHGPGDASLSLPRMAQKGLLASLRAMIQEAQATRAAVQREAVRFRHLDGFRQVDLEVLPVEGPLSRQTCFLILFHPPAGGSPRPAAPPRPSEEPADEQIRVLEEELAATREYLRSIAEEQGAANSALEIANQEILSSNEELQSLNEEIETAKEELQSSNEELTTLNEELHQRNAELAQIGDDLLNLLSALHVPVVLLSRNVLVRRVTPGAARLLGLRPSSIGQPLELPSEFGLPDFPALIREVMESETEMERELQDCDGSWHLLRLLPYRSRQGRVEGAVMLLIDIDALKRTGESVARARDFADAVVETVPAPLLILDALDGCLRVERVNRAFSDVFRVSREETVGRPFFELGEGQWEIPALRARLADLLSGGHEFHGLEVEQEFRGLGRRILLLSGRRVRQDTAGPGKILLALDDRTKEKEAEREGDRLLAREQAAARRAEEGIRVKDEFLATVSHELRGPLSAMGGWLQVLELRSAEPATFARGLAAIRDNVEAQTRLVEDLLATSQMMAMKLRLTLRLIDLVPVVEAAVEAVRSAVEAKGLKLEFRYGTAPILVLGDPARLQQIAWNLLSNAVKFTPPGGAIDVWVGRGETTVELKVRDTGKGIGTDFLPHVFERFRQEDSSFTRGQIGLGLGLAIVRQLAELHGGGAAAESEGEGQGATFTVNLPIPPVVPLDPGETVERELAGLRVLVVEDDATSREMLAALLEGYGAQVTAAASAAEGFAALSRAVPDVLVSDIGMPEESGYDLIRRIRTLSPERGGAVPAIAFTAYSSEADRREAIDAGFQLHMAKPTEPARLRSTIAELARSRR